MPAVAILCDGQSPLKKPRVLKPLSPSSLFCRWTKGARSANPLPSSLRKRKTWRKTARSSSRSTETDTYSSQDGKVLVTTTADGSPLVATRELNLDDPVFTTKHSVSDLRSLGKLVLDSNVHSDGAFPLYANHSFKITQTTTSTRIPGNTKPIIDELVMDCHVGEKTSLQVPAGTYDIYPITCSSEVHGGSPGGPVVFRWAWRLWQEWRHRSTPFGRSISRDSQAYLMQVRGNSRLAPSTPATRQCPVLLLGATAAGPASAH